MERNAFKMVWGYEYPFQRAAHKWLTFFRVHPPIIVRVGGIKQLALGVGARMEGYDSHLISTLTEGAAACQPESGASIMLLGRIKAITDHRSAITGDDHRRSPKTQTSRSDHRKLFRTLKCQLEEGKGGRGRTTWSGDRSLKLCKSV